MQNQKQQDVKLLGGYRSYGEMLRTIRNAHRHTAIDWQITRECANKQVAPEFKCLALR